MILNSTNDNRPSNKKKSFYLYIQIHQYHVQFYNTLLSSVYSDVQLADTKLPHHFYQFCHLASKENEVENALSIGIKVNDLHEVCICSAGIFPLAVEEDLRPFT